MVTLLYKRLVAYHHEGHSYGGDATHAAEVCREEVLGLDKFCRMLTSAGVGVPPHVSAGATPSVARGMQECVDWGRVTEVHPGNYVFFGA